MFAGAKEVILLDIEPCALQCALLAASLSGLDAADAAAIDVPEGALSLAASHEERAALETLQVHLQRAAFARQHGESDSEAAPERHDGSGQADTRAGLTEAELSGGSAGALRRNGQAQSRNASTTADLGSSSPALAEPSSATASLLEVASAAGVSDGVSRQHSATQQQRSAAPRTLATAAASATAAAAAAPCKVSAAVFDWSRPYEGPEADVVLACDVLYEKGAAEPLARVVPAMLRGSGSEPRLLLTDPPERSPEYRLHFMACLAENDVQLAVEVNSIVGAVSGSTLSAKPLEPPGWSGEAGAHHAVQLMVLRRRDGGDTVGLPLSSVK